MDWDRVTAHGEVPVFIDDGFELFPEQLYCQPHTAPEMSSQLARYAFDHLAWSPGERIADFSTRLKQLAVACKFTAGDQ